MQLLVLKILLKHNTIQKQLVLIFAHINTVYFVKTNPKHYDVGLPMQYLHDLYPQEMDENNLIINCFFVCHNSDKTLLKEK